MLEKNKCLTFALAAAVAILALFGCRQGAQSGEIYVMFDDNPSISADSVYWHSQTIGSIRNIEVGENAITKVAVVLDLARKNEFPLRCSMEKV